MHVLTRGKFQHVIARSEATWQSASLRQHEMKSNTLGESEKHYEFALRIANLQSFSAGTRIAAPVCALVRNDMLKEEACVRLQGRLARGHAETWQVCAGQGRNDMQKAGRRARVQGRLARKVRRNLPGVSGCKGLPHCHCEERSDVAIRISCGRA